MTTESEFEKWREQIILTLPESRRADYRAVLDLLRGWILEKAREYSERVEDPFVRMVVEELLK